MKQEILDSLTCRGILDTRKLQEFRIEAIGKEGYHNKNVKETSPKMYEETKAIFLSLSDSDLHDFYKLSIPMTYSSGSAPSYFGVNSEGYETSCYRYSASSRKPLIQGAALHVTTSKGLERISEVLHSSGIKTTLGKTGQGLFDLFDKERSKDASRDSEPAIIAPHDWYSGCMEYEPRLVNIAFTVFEQELHAKPYYYSFSTIINEKPKVGISGDDSLERTVHSISYKTKPVYYCPDHYMSPEDFLPDLLENQLNNYKENFDENSRPRRKEDPVKELVEASVNLIKIGEAKVLYDPEWISV